jgi:hydroxymethylpyrimidine/phosphomethylpyrimidine kinase
MTKAKYPIIMTIAGSDSGAGAGIQADLKTISATGGYGTSVITAITAQNTCGVSGIHSLPLEIIEKQFNAIISDFEVKSLKTGMLQNTEVINLIAELIKKNHLQNFVLDPVMVATSGDKLILEDTIQILTKNLFPLAKIITPNLDEAEIILNLKIKSIDEMKKAAMKLLDFGSEAVLLKGGHLNLEDANLNKKVYDILAISGQNSPILLTSDRIETKNTHGTGCTLSAAIATFLGLENDIENAVFHAKHYINYAILAGKNLKLGKGNGPLNHFFMLHNADLKIINID